jgi:methylase of polypeptide subunit release factors
MCAPLRVRATAVNDAGQGASQGSIEAAAEWRRVAAERARFFGPVTERMLDLADLRLGGRVLDIGAGAGDQALAAARRVRPTGCRSRKFNPAGFAR